MRPTRLYIKQHAITGMKYLGKSIKEDIEKYTGSGKRWLRHIHKHGKEHVITIWVSEWFYSVDEINEYALRLSKELDIVKSENYANLKEETGTDGGILPDYALESISSKLSGRKKETHSYIKEAAEKKQKYTLETCDWQKERSKRLKEKHAKMQQEERNSIWSHPCQEELKIKLSENRTGKTKENCDRVRKMSDTKIRNNQNLTKSEIREKYTTTAGMSWFHSDIERKQILVNPKDVPAGFVKGRKFYHENKEN